MSNAIIRSNHPADLKLIITKYYDRAMDTYPLLKDQIATTIKGKDAYEVFANRVGMGTLQSVNELGTIPTDSMRQAYRSVVHQEKYGIAAKISREAIRDNKAQDLAAAIGKEMRRGHRETLDIKAAAILNNAFDTDFTYGNGDVLCSTAQDAEYNSQSNRLAVDSDLSESSLEDMYKLIRQLEDMSGRKNMVQPEKVVIHPDNEHELARILRGKERYATADRDINANKYLNLFQADPVVSPHMSDADAFFVLTNRNNDGEGIIYIERDPFMIETDPVPSVQAIDFYGTTRFVYWVLDWKAVFGTPGAA